MDIDIPDLEELEWLEANSHFQEDPLDPPSPNFYPYPPEEEQQPPAQSPPLSTDDRKRPRSDVLGSPNHEEVFTSEEKRSKINGVEPAADEDWLRYSPPQENNSREVEEIVELVEERILSRYASEIDGDFIPVTDPKSGDRVYSKICRVEREERSKKLNVKSQSNGLISEPLDLLLQRLEQEAFTKALLASSESQSDVVLTETHVDEKLWVDKYAPNSFTELLSDEQTNREVLLWLKQWDSCVFGSEIRSTSEDVLSALRRHSSVAQHKKSSDANFPRTKDHRWTNGSFRNYNNLDGENGNLKGIQDLWSKRSRLTGPPEQKILLLCGPPGLGKTTLAHVAPKHCGYRVIEINASDDRSSSTIESKILDVVELGSVNVRGDSRPKCLVIDEIDGALGDGKGAVDVILKMVYSDRRSDTGKEISIKGEQAGKSSSKKGRKAASLLRPVICICNDLYAPVLRPLRQVAKVHIFVQPTISRVVNRLKYICNKEGMKVNSIALAALAEYTECDIRSCLNSLQFLNKKKENLNELEFDSQVVGRKDMSKNLFDVWKEIFQKRKTKRERRSSKGSMSSEFDVLHSLISNRGDYDVIFDGMHENILQLPYHDPLMQKTVKCFNSLGVSDLIHQKIMRTQQMSLYAYQPALAISVHHLLAQVQKPNIEWPKSHQKYRSSLMDKMDMLRSWQNKITPSISRHLSINSVVEDTLSPLLHILAPPTLRPVALHLLSQNDKNDLAQLVSTMVSYSITYKNIKEHEAALEATALSLDPPICDFIKFKGYNSGHNVLPLAVKRVLVHEVEKEKILQAGRSLRLLDGCSKENLNLADGNNREPRSANDKASLSASKIGSGNNILNPKQHNPGATKLPSKLDGTSATSNVKLKSAGKSSSTSFFDRFRKASGKSCQNTNTAVQDTATLVRDSRPVLFKFNEGFTNAVKRPVRMREFLL